MTDTRSTAIRTAPRAILIAALLVLLLPAPSWAQGRLMGQVVDTDGEPIPGVTITVRSLDRGEELQLTTDENGRFVRPGLTLGVYELRFEKEGFVPVVEQRRIAGQTTAEVVLEAATPVGPQGSPEYVQAFESFQQGDYEAAVELLGPLAADNPDFGPAFLLLGRSHLELEQWDEAIDAYTRAAEMNPDEPGIHMDLGTAYVETGQADRAATHFERALELEPGSASAHYNIGVVYFQANEIGRAVEHLQQAVELQPDNALAHKALAFALVRDSAAAQAATHLETYLELSPDAADAAEMTELAEQLRAAAEAESEEQQDR